MTKKKTSKITNVHESTGDSDSGISVKIQAILMLQTAEITREKACDIIHFLLSLFEHGNSCEDMSSMSSNVISAADAENAKIALKKLKKFVNRHGSEVDELRGKIRRVEEDLQKEIKVRENFEKEFEDFSVDYYKVQSYVKGFDLVSLFRAYFFDGIDWTAASAEYGDARTHRDNRVMTNLEFDRFKSAFNAKYITPVGSPLMSDLLEVTHDRHEMTHSGHLKTIVKQEQFIDECIAFFAPASTNRVSPDVLNIVKVILPQLVDLKVKNQLIGMGGKM